MNKNMAKNAVVLLMVFLATACGRTASPTQSRSDQAKDQNVTEPGVLPVVKNQITLTLGKAVGLQVSDHDDNDLTKYLERLTNIKIDFVLYDPGGDGETKLGLQVASGDKLPDIIFGLGIGNNVTREAYGKAGALIPLNDYINNLGVFTKKAVDSTILAQSGVDPWIYGTDDEGNIWGYIYYETVISNFYAARAWYNEEFASRLGMSSDDWTGGGGKGKIPTQEWLYNYLVAVRDNDVNGNGDRNDEIPITGGVGWRQQLLKWLTTQYVYNDYASTNNFWVIRNGQLYYNYDMPEYRDALRFINRLYREKLFEDVAITQNAVTLGATVNAKPYKVGVTVSGGIGIYDADARAVYKPIPIVEGPNGFATTTYFQQIPTFPFAITSFCEYPEAAFRWLDAPASDGDFPLYARYGVKDRDWRLARPGEIGLYGENSGIQPYFVQLIMTWGNVVTNAHWKSEFGIDYLNRKSSIAWSGDPVDPEYLHGQALMGMFPFTPAEYPVNLIFATSENEQWAETRTNIRNYVDQCLAQFATGQLNIESDWDAYIRNLRTLGSDQLLAVDRAAYARMMRNTGR